MLLLEEVQLTSADMESGESPMGMMLGFMEISTGYTVYSRSSELRQEFPYLSSTRQAVMVDIRRYELG